MLAIIARPRRPVRTGTIFRIFIVSSERQKTRGGDDDKYLSQLIAATLQGSRGGGHAATVLQVDGRNGSSSVDV